jgi:glycosyltransferase involved in cell wall biosynthesis
VRRVLAPAARGPIAPGEVPSFSVIVAAHQAELTIVEAVESALAQTLPPREVIVCDDGSTDGTSEALARYGERIVLLRQDQGGEAAAKNAAARVARGDFVAILDADDVYLPERLEAMGLLAAERPDLDILTTDALIEMDGQFARRCYEHGFSFAVEDQRSAILMTNFIFGLAAVRRSRLEAIGGFDESIRYTTDWDLWLRLILDGSLAGVVMEPLARYRLQHGSLSSQRARMLVGRLQTLHKVDSRNDLSGLERGVLARSIARHERLLRVAEAREALLERRPDRRRRAIAVVTGRGHGLLTRLKALAAVIAPRSAGERLVASDRETTAGILVPREPADAPPSGAGEARQ